MVRRVTLKTVKMVVSGARALMRASMGRPVFVSCLYTCAEYANE